MTKNAQISNKQNLVNRQAKVLEVFMGNVTINNKYSMIVRYFLKTDCERKPTAVIRLVIDNEKKTLLDQFWNPANNVWERGAYGMGAIDWSSRCYGSRQNFYFTVLPGMPG